MLGGRQVVMPDNGDIRADTKRQIPSGPVDSERRAISLTTPGRPFSARLTAAADTPASRATSRIPAGCRSPPC